MTNLTGDGAGYVGDIDLEPEVIGRNYPLKAAVQADAKDEKLSWMEKRLSRSVAGTVSGRALYIYSTCLSWPPGPSPDVAADLAGSELCE